ncbi:hypothetical protein CIB84_014928 [Bambusicola thoracicus]|nr:hypothetical protein CIB84_014928 [Bambusicola thoracicus]
MIKNLKK